ncbi:MAG TPA: hemerythrin domain-containing protein [Spirochaetia bacterium]|nr:hemerythrin domain-containing protein [Spirochaetales bacterium]HRW23368.1 hemerythrin domain-containing protein [Spirochaetia bacterium]
MDKVDICDGVSVVGIPEAGLSVLCGCPENVVKFMIRGGAIRSESDGGRSYETGPNAILLSELPIQNGRFSNLAEFPVLQMLYRQGLIVPGHPRNTGVRPMLIGLRDQVEAQARYIYAGNYGITEPEALDPDDPAAAAEMIRMKRKFSFGAFRSLDELLDVRVIDGPVVGLRDGAFLRRLGVNRYELICGGASVDVDLNLGPGASYGAPYALPRSRIGHDAFSVVHLGEGDGWDPERPCMCSLVVHEGRRYLIDAGPNIEESLDAVGLGVGDLAGVFHTHVHDDHFVGLTSLMRADRRLSYYAVPMVRRSATEKLRALCGVDADDFARLFDVVDLRPDEWNDVGGLGVRPIYSPHPLETTILRFRAAGADGYRTYAHYADLSSFAVIDSMVTDDASAAGVTAAEAERAKAAYLEPADVKKVDVGGGMIHGDPDDFAGDRSGDLLLSHGDSVEALAGRGFGRVASFGEVSVLAPARRDWAAEAAACALRRYFPDAPAAAIEALASRPCRERKAGDRLLSAGSAPLAAPLTLDGRVTRVAVGGPSASYGPGALLGAVAALRGEAEPDDWVVERDAAVVELPAEAFAAFARAAGLEAEILRSTAAVAELAALPLFGGIGSMDSLYGLAKASRRVESGGGALDAEAQEDELLVLISGEASLTYGGIAFEELAPGAALGDERALCRSMRLFSAVGRGPTTWLAFPRAVVEARPALLWRLREGLERRLAIVKAVFEFRWRAEYELGIAAMDAQHRRIFGAMDEVTGAADSGATSVLERLEVLLSDHFSDEEALQESVGYPGREEHAREHDELLGELSGYMGRVRAGDSVPGLADFMKDCFIRHTLLEDRKYAPWVLDGDLRKS